MNLIDLKVEHINFGKGTVVEEKDNKIYVKFQEGEGTKIFIYPDAFEKFLKAEDETAAFNILEELNIKLQQLEIQRRQQESKILEAEEAMKKYEPVKRKRASKAAGKKAL